MNMQTETIAGVIRVPAHTLILADENPRTDADEETIKELANSIAENGQLTPLIAYLEDDKHHVTAGGRRYRAMAMLGWTNELVDVAIYEKNDAIHYGVAEQLAHEKLSRVDEVKLFATPTYTNVQPKKLADMIGKSVAYVKQHLRVLCLPEEPLQSFFDGDIDYENALGLTYFIDSDLMSEVYQEVISAPRWWDLEKLRNRYIRSYGEWDNHPFAKYVDKDEYLGAGGVLEEDLFGGTALIRTPEILKTLAVQAIEVVVRGRAPKGEAVVRLADGESLYEYAVHPGENLLTADETEELSDLMETDLDGMERAFPEEGENHEFEYRDGEIVSIKWARERTEDLEEKETSYPDELSALLTTVWRPQEHMQGGYSMRSSCIHPDQEQALIAGGWIEAEAEDAYSPEDGPQEPEEEEGLSQALLERIKGVKLHSFRQVLSADPNGILMYYSASLEGMRPLHASFEFRPVDLPAVTLHFDKAYQKLQAAQEKKAVTPSATRDRLAYNLLTRVSGATDVPKDGETIRKYFTPDAEFLKAYKKDQLWDMLHEVDARAAVERKASPKNTLCEVLAKIVAEKKDWLPVGF